MRRNVLRSSPLVGALVALPLAFGCPAKKETAPAETAAKPVEKAAPKPAPVPSGGADPLCMAAWSPTGEAKALAAGARTLQQTGTQVVETSKDDDAKAVLGVLANIKEDTEDNLKNIQAALAFFKEKGADAVVVVGDLGESESQIANVLKPIAATGLPVFTIVGNREKRTDYASALKATAAAHPNVVDMNQARLVKLDDVALVSIPGYYDKAYIHAEDGCQYFPADLEGTQAVIKAAGTTPVVLVSHGPPKQDGSEALDRTLEQANVGDANLSKLIEESGVKFGIFANIQEAGGRGTDRSGKTLVKPGTPAESLFLNPGAIDAVSWEMNDGSRSVGMAAVMTLDGGQASFEVFRVPAAAE
jgi:Icc-related predicted phosphoesterase